MNHATATRPPTFDAALVAYLPGLRRRSEFVTRTKQEAEELLQETVADMLASWRTCRMETFKTWAQLKMWQVQYDMREKACRMKRSANVVDISVVEIGKAPDQHHAAELAETVRALRTIPNGDIVLRRAMGADLLEIGRERGITREAIRQKQERAVATLRKRMNVRRAA